MKLECAGILHYDIPDEIAGLANKLRRKLRQGHALPASKSVYIINWADEPSIQNLIEECKATWAKKHPSLSGCVSNLRINAIKADDSSADRIHQMAVDGLTALINGIVDSIQKKKAKMEKEAEAAGLGVGTGGAADGMSNELPEDVQARLVKRLEEAEMLAVAFRLMGDVGVVLDEVRRVVVANLGAKVAARAMKAAKKDQPEAQQPLAFMAAVV